MARKKRKQRPIYKRGGHSRIGTGGKAVGALVIGATGASLIGSAMPVGTGEALTTAGGTMAGFVSPAVTVVGAGMVLNSLKMLPQPKSKLNKK